MICFLVVARMLRNGKQPHLERALDDPERCATQQVVPDDLVADDAERFHRTD